MNFFDEHPVLYPWPEILRETGFYFTYKPREVFWKKEISRLGLKPGKKVLDMGCGEGILLDRLKKDYQIEGFGVDNSYKTIERAKKNSLFQHDFRLAEATTLPFPDLFFDVVISFDTLEHVQDKDQSLAEIGRVLKKHGRLLIYTINKNQAWTWNWLISKLGVDIYQRVDHRPEDFVDPKRLSFRLKSQRIATKRIAYFNAFFSLLADEIIMIFIQALEKSGLNQKKIFGEGRLLLAFLTVFSRFSLPFFNFLDHPWLSKGYANSFMLLGEKE